MKLSKESDSEDDDEEMEMLVGDNHTKRRSRGFLVLLILFPVILSVITYCGINGIPKYVDVLLGERCSSRYWTPKNFTCLKDSLDRNVFGQHIALNLIKGSLKRRWATSYEAKKKPLVMSFHGWTGSGKNYVAKFVAECLFLKGLSSDHVRLFISTLHFYDDTQVSQYKVQLRQWILGNVTRCPETLFIFDEVDKMPKGLLDSLKPFMDFHDNIDGVDMRKATFILLSNTGGREITRTAYSHWQLGRRRTDLAYMDLEPLISKGAFNEEGGLHHSALIDKSLIDVYVPFLPLERVHVKQCAQRELEIRLSQLENKEEVDTSQLVEQIVQQVPFWPEDTHVYASSGCKRISQKIDLYLYSKGY